MPALSSTSPATQAFSFPNNAVPYLFVNIVFSYKYVYQSILSSVIKLIEVKQQVFLFLQEEYVEIKDKVSFIALFLGCVLSVNCFVV